ncbi:MAG: glycosyltransferase [Anaerolineae bacterium]|nr:glycosyltransferase [Anaerolineae bacterium]
MEIAELASTYARAHGRLEQVFLAAPTVAFDSQSRFVFLGDCHRGNGGRTDAFAVNEDLVCHALSHYFRAGFTYVEVGDGDELWQNRCFNDIRRAHGRTYDLLHRFHADGRLAPEKQVDWLRPVLDAQPDARLAIVGDGPARAELEVLFSGTPTTFTGYLRGADLAHAYASADVFAFPSANETFGNVVLEAMASGLPVVVPRSGGPVDHVFHDLNGLLSDPDNPSDFVCQVERLLDNPDQRRRLGLDARAYAEKQSWCTILDRLLADLEQVAHLTRRSLRAQTWRVPPPDSSVVA